MWLEPLGASISVEFVLTSWCSLRTGATAKVVTLRTLACDATSPFGFLDSGVDGLGNRWLDPGSRRTPDS